MTKLLAGAKPTEENKFFNCRWPSARSPPCWPKRGVEP
jgi:hypothetical protein